MRALGAESRAERPSSGAGAPPPPPPGGGGTPPTRPPRGAPRGHGGPTLRFAHPAEWSVPVIGSVLIIQATVSMASPIT